jgi:carboxyl-terminal processing protease
MHLLCLVAHCHLRFPGSLLFLALALLFTATAQGELPTAQRTVDKQITKVVVSFLTRQNFSKHPLDDEIARRTFDRLFDALDRSKLYFLQSDLHEFTAGRDAIDDQLKEGDLSLAYKVYPRLLMRIDERVKQVDELLKEQHDFTVKEEYSKYGKGVKFPQDANEARERWRKRIKYDLLTLKAEKIEGQVALDRLTRRYHSFATLMQQTDADEILEIYLNALAGSFDSQSSYQSPTTVTNWAGMAGQSLEGIGAQLNVIDGSIQVNTVVPGGAADKHGKLQAGDKLVSVAQGEMGEAVDVREMKLTDAVKLIRGQADTVVRLGVLPRNGTQTVYYDITRAKIELKGLNTTSEVFDVAKKPSGAPFRIGVIVIPSFYMDSAAAQRGDKDFRSCTRDVRKILDDFKSQKVDAVMLDLRSGGGSLTEAISVAGLFLDQGPVLQVRDADGRVQHYDDLERGMAWSGPVVALAGSYSQGGGEIVLGALQDYQRALIVGEPSVYTSRGNVTSTLNLGEQMFRVPNPPQFGVLNLSMQQHYRPTGTSREKGRINPDILLPSAVSYLAEREVADRAEAEIAVPTAMFTKVNGVSAAQVEKLQATSQARTSSSADFKNLRQLGERRRQRADRKATPLSEQEFFAERAESEELNKFLTQTFRGAASDASINRDYYLNEVLAITADFASLTQSPTAPLPTHPQATTVPAVETPAVPLTEADRARLEAEKKAAADVAEGWRIWVSTAGTKVEARYKGQVGQAVRLEKRDGKIITVPLNLLSEGDLEWLKQQK